MAASPGQCRQMVEGSGLLPLAFVSFSGWDYFGRSVGAVLVDVEGGGDIYRAGPSSDTFPEENKKSKILNDFFFWENNSKDSVFKELRSHAI